jgi:hypothetical protein
MRQALGIGKFQACKAATIVAASACSSQQQSSMSMQMQSTFIVMLADLQIVSGIYSKARRGAHLASKKVNNIQLQYTVNSYLQIT